MSEEIVWKGNPELEPFLVPIGDLVEDPANTNEHDEDSYEKIKGSYARFGQQKPIVHRDSVVRDGNGQLVAARRLGWTHLAALRSDLEGAELAGYAIAANKTGLLSQFNFERLAATLRELPTEIQLATGFEQWELDPLLKGTFEPRQAKDGDGSDDGPPEMISFRATRDQAEVIQEAISRVREQESHELSEGRCLVLIAADFLSGYRKGR